MKKFKVKQNLYLNRDVVGYYNCEYLGYQQKGNPDFINRLKNMTKTHSEMDLVQDFIEVAERAEKDLKDIIDNENLFNPVVCVAPRSKAEKIYSNCQLMFRKAISSVVNNLGLANGCECIKRIKDTKTTHNWRLENNTGDMPYKGITKDTCEINKKEVYGRDVILIDDIYTENVNIAEDIIQTIFDLGAKSVTLYVIAKTRS